jgi:hypothetical protein
MTKPPLFLTPYPYNLSLRLSLVELSLHFKIPPGTPW